VNNSIQRKTKVNFVRNEQDCYLIQLNTLVVEDQKYIFDVCSQIMTF